MGIVAWVATPGDVAEATNGVLRFVRDGEPHEHILASAQTGGRATGSCVLLTARPVAWLDGFTAPPGELWGNYISALASAALRRAGELDREFVEIDITNSEMPPAIRIIEVVFGPCWARSFRTRPRGRRPGSGADQGRHGLRGGRSRRPR